MLFLVRHAMPVVDPAVAPADWVLSAQGRAAAQALVQLLPPDAYLVASAEPKAAQTLQDAGEPRIDGRFGEVVRVGEPFGGDFLALRRAYVEGTDHPGWEPRAQVVARFDAAVGDQARAAAGRPLVVATHGMAMTTWLTARLGLDDPGVFWAGLQFPDVLEVDLTTRRIARCR
ncbi:MAG: histidine phosphatase family protein [Hamadaea sp.]|nr:histidine phosphatase family protein [Hamadaea sp.]